MKFLRIENSDQLAMVDDEDYERLIAFKWFLNGKKTAICRDYTVNLERIYVSLSSIVMQKEKLMFDHKDRNIFNNLKENLRKCDQSQNLGNRKNYKNSRSIFKGVCWAKREGSWLARICMYGVRRHLGYFKSEVEAAIAYNVAAMTTFKEFACLNPIPFTW